MQRAPGLIGELISRPRCLTLGVLVAALAAGTRFVGVGLLPPSITVKHLAHSTATTLLLIGKSHSLNSSSDKNLYVTAAIPLAWTLSDLSYSPEVRGLIARAARIPKDQLAVDGPVWSNVVQIQQWPSRGKRDNQIIVETVPYRLTIDVSSTVPVIAVTAQAPTTAQAAVLAGAAQRGLSKYLTRLQQTTNTVASKRYQVTRLAPISVSPGGHSGLANIAAFTFATVLFIWCGLMLFLPRLIEDLRRTLTSAKVPG